MTLLHWKASLALFGLFWTAFRLEVAQGDQTCYRDYTKGVLYRGTANKAITGFLQSTPCQKWTDQSPNSHSYTAADYPSTGLGDHNYCRNPDVNGTRTLPWCYLSNKQGWKYCLVWPLGRCSDSSCYSSIGKGSSYSGGVTKASVNSKTYTCMKWSDVYNSNYDFSAWPGLKKAIAGHAHYIFGSGNKCRNPGFVYEKPWCYYKPSASSQQVENGTCDIPKCNDVAVVSQTCGGNGGSNACVFPFKYRGFTFINCTMYTRSVSWCATETDSDHEMTKWGYCQCPRPTTQVPTTVGRKTTTQSATTQSPTTQSATTTSPTTESSTTKSPTTQSPTTRSPTESPTTKSPTTESPTTRSPTESPTTKSPTTTLPTTELSTTQSPTTQSPTTTLPTTESSTTKSPTTRSPTTTLPTTELSTTRSPKTTLPTAESSTTQLPTTQAVTTRSFTSQAVTTGAGSPSKPTTTPSMTTQPATKKQSTMEPVTTQFTTLSTTTPKKTISEKPLLTTESVPSSTVAIHPTNESQTGPADEELKSQALLIYIGAAAGGAAVLVIIVILIFVCCRQKKKGKMVLSSSSQDDAIYMGSLECSTSRLPHNAAENPVYMGSNECSMSKPVNAYASAGPQEERKRENYYTAVDARKEAVVMSNRESQYAKDQGRGNIHTAPPALPARRSVVEMTAFGGVAELFYAPANTVERLYGQFEEQKTRQVHREDLIIKQHLGSGEFGNVEKAIWRTGAINKEVAVKTLISDDKRDRVQFLKEAAVMGQFHHQNIVALQGLVTEGEPLMIVIEFMGKGDLKMHLVDMDTTNDSTLPASTSKTFLKWTNDIAAGMKYLSQKGFVHRDLAARNVMLDEKLIAKVGDFGLSRDLDESEYYHFKSKTKIPVRWTSPEAINYKKYSSSSDVWSFGIVMYEIWSVGKRPYGYAKNSDVLANLEKGDRLPPPPGCPRAIYAIMIDCWNPDHHERPKFSQLASRLGVDLKKLLVNRSREEQIKGELGGPLADGTNMYRDLKLTYVAM